MSDTNPISSYEPANDFNRFFNRYKELSKTKEEIDTDMLGAIEVELVFFDFKVMLSTTNRSYRLYFLKHGLAQFYLFFNIVDATEMASYLFIENYSLSDREREGKMVLKTVEKCLTRLREEIKKY